MFMVLDSQFNAKVIENKVRENFDQIHFNNMIKNKIANRNNLKLIGYVDGPPTMNGEPHAGHLRGRIIKDLWHRYNTLKQNQVIFRPGWDTQGLPVELQVEKELGLTGNKTDNINRVGIERIVEACKSLVKKYNEKWLHVDKLLGMSFDYENGYWTFYDNYIEREWSYLKKAWDNKILQEGFRVVAFCPSCQTSLSNAEVNQGYATVEDPSFYYKVKLLDEDVYLVVWTTMPFTLVTDELTGVNPDANYVYVRVKNEIWLIGESRLQELMKELHIDNYEPIKIIKGNILDGLRYIHPLLDLIPGLKELVDSKLIHFVVAEDMVDITTGSGIVHLSPANGEEDFNIAKKRKVPIFVPIDDRVIFTEQAGTFKDMFVRDADHKVVEIMTQLGHTVKISKIKHQYPTCWRSHHKLVWLARREYFYMVDKLGDKPLQAASSVEYFYDPPKNRFIEIIKEKVPWCISRERIWGTPLPIWVCQNCGEKELLSSRKVLVERSNNLLYKNNSIIFKSKVQNSRQDEENNDTYVNSNFNNCHFELHRPWIDRVELSCLKCNSGMQREPFVLDTWHNSGSAPYASFSDEEYGNLIPALFLTEGIDQTRGWSYSLLMENVILNNASIAPFKSFLFQGHVLDEKGNKMSKSAGNVIDAALLLDQHPVDLIRFYFIWKSSPIESLNFSIKEMGSRPYQILSTLYYLHVYLKQNSALDNFNRNKHNLEWIIQNNLLELPEKWLLSILQKLIYNVTNYYENCRFHEAAKDIEEFIINNISQTYIPLTRNAIWNDNVEEINRRLTIYATLDYVLEKIDIILHPISPFLTDYLYLNCFLDNKLSIKKTSILLSKWPEPLNNLINDNLEKTFEKIKNIISISNSARMKAKLKRRWPISNITICNFYDKNLPKDISFEIEFSRKEVSDILKNQLNVENIQIKQISANNKIEKILGLLETNNPIIPLVSLVKKNIAPHVKADIGKVINSFEQTDKVTVLRSLQESDTFSIKYDSELSSIEISKDDVDVSFNTMDHFVSAERENFMIFVSSLRDPVLIDKGLLRDLARNLQQLRKEKSYNPTEILSTAYVARLDNQEISSLSKFKDELTYLVRVKSLIMSEQEINDVAYKKIDIDGKELSISIF